MSKWRQSSQSRLQVNKYSGVTTSVYISLRLVFHASSPIPWIVLGLIFHHIFFCRSSEVRVLFFFSPGGGLSSLHSVVCSSTIVPARGSLLTDQSWQGFSGYARASFPDKRGLGGERRSVDRRHVQRGMEQRSTMPHLYRLPGPVVRFCKRIATVVERT